MADEREPDVSEDPRQKGTGGQLPEEGHEGEGAGEGRPGTEGRGGGAPAPADGDPGQATGNPDAAGAS